MIRILTRHLVALLEDLALTAAPADGAYPTLAGVLLFTDRGYPDASEPGKADVLVGTSTNRRVAGQAFVQCDGQMTPMLWPVAKVASVVSVFKPKCKGKDNSEHGVYIERGDDGHVIVREDPNLYDDGDKIEFKLGDLDDYPHATLTRSIEQPPRHTAASVAGYIDKPRTDYYPADLVLVCKIGTRRNAPIETYRVDQDTRLLVRIGEYWRGWIKPVPFEQDTRQSRQTGLAPEGEVFHTDLADNDVEIDPMATGPRPAAPVEDVLPLEPVPVAT